MKSVRQHTPLALALAVTAVVVPSAAWYAVGMREVAREIEALSRQRSEGLARVLAQAADRLELRLETLRESESQRPYYHYQRFYHDPRGASEGASVIPSPLAEPPSDGLVQAYFQISPREGLTLPNLASTLEVPQQAAPVEAAGVAADLRAVGASGRQAADAHWLALRDALTSLAPEATRAVRGAATRSPLPEDSPAVSPRPSVLAAGIQTSDEPARVAQASPRPSSAGEGPRSDDVPDTMPKNRDDSSQGVGDTIGGVDRQHDSKNGNNSLGYVLNTKAGGAKSGSMDKRAALQKKSRTVRSKVEVLPTEAYVQNMAAPEIYQSLKNSASAGQAGSFTTLQTALQGYAQNRIWGQDAQVQIRSSELQLVTLALAGAPRLFALREVLTPEGARVQGFLLEPGLLEAVGAAEGGEGIALRLQPGAGQGEADRSLEGWGAPWHLHAEPSWELEAVRGSEVRAGFLRTFFAGVTAAFLAVLGLVVLVFQAERLARERARFAAAAAHELRTPLAGLRLYSEMLAEGLGDPTRSQEYARRVASEAERLARVVSNVLEVSRLERGRLSVRPAPGDFRAAVLSTLERLRPALEAMGSRLEVLAPQDLPPVMFDPDALDHILQNLLDNAEKYSRNSSNRLIQVTLAIGAKRAQVKVRDYGMGISPQTRRRLFQPFERGQHPDLPPGLGLGLSLAHALASAQGGAVEVERCEGPGACLVLSLALAPSALPGADLPG